MVKILDVLFSLLCISAHVSAQEPSAAVGTVMDDGTIVAVDSDFIFMEIKPSTLPAEAKAGLGVFAKVDIPPQEILCEYRGAIVSSDVQYESDYIYSSRTSTNELISIIPDSDKPICSFINDCVVASAESYTDSELDEIEMGKGSLKVHNGFYHNAGALITKMGKVFVISNSFIPAGAEIFFAYGNNYWLARLRQLGQGHAEDGALSGEAAAAVARRQAPLSSTNTLQLM